MLLFYQAIDDYPILTFYTIYTFISHPHHLHFTKLTPTFVRNGLFDLPIIRHIMVLKFTIKYLITLLTPTSKVP